MKRNKIKKELFIIHNLITYTYIAQVEDYIKDYLLNSATFDLEEGHKISTIEKGEIKGKYYYEKTDEQKIFHLIFANEDSEAGNYYNDFTLQFIENTYQNVINTKQFDIIESVKERFIELSKDFIENTGENKIGLNDFANFEEMKDKKIKLNKEKEITLKKCLIDELGFLNIKHNGFEPLYNYFKKDDLLIIRIECPGNCSMDYELDFFEEYTIIKLTGEKKKDKEPEKLEDNIYNNREFGEFSLEIPFKTEDYLIKNEEPSLKEKKGLLILDFKLDKKKDKIIYPIQNKEEV